MREVPRTAAATAVHLNLLDRALGWFAPATALQRGQARARLEIASGSGGYSGGRRDRRMLRAWRPPAGDADADTLPDLPDLRARSRDAIRNDPISGGAIATNVTHVVGEELQLQAAIDANVLGLTAEQADGWERTAEQEFRLWSRSADFTRVQSFGALQRLALRAVLESGDVFVVRRWRQDSGDVYGTKLQMIEADRVSNPNRAADSETIAGGVEHDGHGVPLAYHVSDKHPGASRVGALTWTRVPARTGAGTPVVLHLFDRLRPGQTRGLPYLAPVIEHLKKLSRYSDAEVSAAVVAALQTVFVLSDADASETPIVGEHDASHANNEVKLGEGAVISLAPGEKVEAPMPGRPNTNFDPFFIAVVRQIGVALELPFELLMKHFTASYSASKAAIEMAYATFKARRGWLASAYCQVMYEWFLEEAIAVGRLPAPGFFGTPLIRQAYAGAEWIGPPRMSLDPLKEANADAADVALGVKTREQVCLERTGGQYEDKHRQLAKEQTMRAADRLPDPDTPAAAPPSGDDTSDVEGDLPANRRASA